MKFNNVFTLNDWKFKEFSIVIVAIQILMWIVGFLSLNAILQSSGMLYIQLTGIPSFFRISLILHVVPDAVIPFFSPASEIKTVPIATAWPCVISKSLIFSIACPSV